MCSWTLTSNYPQEDVFGGVKSSCIDAGGVGRVAFADDSTGETRDCALCDGSLFSLLTSCYRVRHHEVYGTFCGTPNLGGKGEEKQSIIHHVDLCITRQYTVVKYS